MGKRRLCLFKRLFEMLKDLFVKQGEAMAKSNFVTEVTAQRVRRGLILETWRDKTCPHGQISPLVSYSKK